MRIPSQFNEDNLYRRGNRPSQPVDSIRQLVRLAVALVLLVFVMYHAGQPRHYEIFFGDPAADASDSLAVGEVSIQLSTQQQRVKDIPVTAPSRQVASALTRTISNNDQQAWSSILVSWNLGKPFVLKKELFDAALAALEGLADIDAGELAGWRETLQTFGSLYGDDFELADAVRVVDLTDEEAGRMTTWLDALDEAALRRVVDGSVWRSADFDAFYMQLAQADYLTTGDAVHTSVVPLLQQPETYLGQLVRVSGVVAKADRMDASENPHSIDSYWQLWVRPDTGSARPIVFVVPRLPKSISESVLAGGQPRARFVGRFFKRLAYRSQIGADLAPVVIGKVWVRPTTTRQPAPTVATSSGGISNRNRFLLTLLCASVIGITLASITMWRTSVAANRSRELRARQQPHELSADLNQSIKDFEAERE